MTEEKEDITPSQTEQSSKKERHSQRQRRKRKPLLVFSTRNGKGIKHRHIPAVNQIIIEDIDQKPLII